MPRSMALNVGTLDDDFRSWRRQGKLLLRRNVDTSKLAGRNPARIFVTCLTSPGGCPRFCSFALPHVGVNRHLQQAGSERCPTVPGRTAEALRCGTESPTPEYDPGEMSSRRATPALRSFRGTATLASAEARFALEREGEII